MLCVYTAQSSSSKYYKDLAHRHGKWKLEVNLKEATNDIEFKVSSILN
jgi:hypothetical protein